jgi:hypothetical protein
LGKTSKRTLERSEHDEQVAVFAWTALKEKEFPELKLLQGSLNGVRLTIGQAVKAKRAGLKKGWPDLFLPVALHGFNGLFIELKKRKGGVMSADQAAMWKQLSLQGYKCTRADGSDAAISILEWYLK